MSTGKIGHLELLAANNLDVDQVVWARAKGYSFWPAQVFEEDETIMDTVPNGTVPVRFLDDNSWAYVSPKDIADFVADYDATYEVAMPKETELRRKFLRAVRVGRQLTGMTGWIACEACNKWRQFPCTMLGLGDGWVCKMNTWDNCNSCSVPEQDPLADPDNEAFDVSGVDATQVLPADAPTLHPTEQSDVCYLEFHSHDKIFTGKVHITMTTPPLIYVRDVFGIVWRTEDTRRLNDKYKNHKSKFEHLLKYHTIGPGKTKAVASVGDLDALLTCFNEDVAKTFVDEGELDNLKILLARACGQKLPIMTGAGGAGVASSNGEDDWLPINWSTLSFLSQDRKFKCEVRLTKAGAEGKHHVSLTDFLSIVGRLQPVAVAKAAYYVRTRLGSVLRCVRDVPLVPLTELLAVLRLLPMAIVQEYRECGDEQRFRDTVMTFAELPELLAQEAESWTVTGRMPAASERFFIPKSPRSPRSSSGSAAQAWIGKFVRLKPGVKGFGGCIGQVCSAANGYYLIRLRTSGTSVKVRSADMYMVDENEEDIPDEQPDDSGDASAIDAGSPRQSLAALDDSGDASAIDAGSPRQSLVATSPRQRAASDQNGPSAFVLDAPGEDAAASADATNSPRSSRNRTGSKSPRRGVLLGAMSEAEDLAASEELGYERGRSRCGLRVKWTNPPAISAADLVCLIAGVETRREASVVVSELKDRLLASNAVAYCTIKGFPKSILCVKSNSMDVFLSVLPSHYMVSDEAVARFKESHRIAWLNEQLSLGDSASAQSPIFKATAGPMPTEMELTTKAQDNSSREDAKDTNANNVSAGGELSAAGKIEAGPASSAAETSTAAPAPAPAATAVDQDNQKEHDDSGVKAVVESMVSTTAANETMQSPANPASSAEDSNGSSAPPDQCRRSLAESASTTSIAADDPKDVSFSALANRQGPKRSREEEDEGGGTDGGEEGATKRMREEGASSTGDAETTMS